MVGRQPASIRSQRRPDATMEAASTVMVGAAISVEEDTMGKTGRKRRARKKKGANHGKRPNA
jgi:hypothetical protein